MCDTPSRLYKYRRIGRLDDTDRDNARELLTDRRVYFSPTKDLNDPFDCTAVLDQTANQYQWRRFLNRLFKEEGAYSDRRTRERAVEQMLHLQNKGEIAQRVMDRMRNDWRIFCMSGDPANVLMWSHYAEGHRGFVVELNAEAGTYWSKAFKVDYPEQYPLTTLTQDPDTQMRLMVATKSSHWEYEDEYRLVRKIEDDEKYQFPAEQLTAVIFGYSMPTEYRTAVREMVVAGDCNPEFRQCEKSNQYGLIIRPCSS